MKLALIYNPVFALGVGSIKTPKTIKKKTKRTSGGGDEQGQNTISKFK